MYLTRFEFQGTGIFHTLDVLEGLDLDKPDEEDLVWAERWFDEFLPVPIMPEGTRTESYFTEKGLHTFKEPLDVLISLYRIAEDIGFGELRIIEKWLTNEEVYYEDENQMVLLPREKN